MRKILALLLVAVMVLSAVACGNDTDGASSAPDSTIGDVVQTTTTQGEAGLSTTSGRRPGETGKATGNDSSGSTKTTANKDGGKDDASTSDTSNGNGTGVTKWEKPVTYNTAILYNPQSSSYDAEAEKTRLSIVNSKSEVGPSTTGNTYYISPKGDDLNDGLSPDTAWQTLEKLYLYGRYKSGDVVLFERGAVYRGHVPMVSGVSYGAYGVGTKPAIYGSLKNYADPALWQKTNREHVWKLAVGSMDDIGNIVFDHGKVCASDFRQIKNKLDEDFEFHHDSVNGYLYMYLSLGNPGELYDDVEVCHKEHVLSSSSKDGALSNVRVDNLCIKYGGAHGIGIGKAENITITNCEVGYIGGSELNSTNDDGSINYCRYGNGIEFWSHATNIVVKNNWIYQCYDAGYTNQGQGARHTDLLIKDNLIEYCNYNIEIFGSYVAEDGTIKGLLKNCVYDGNVLRFAGYGFGTNNRTGSNDSAVSAICYWRSFIPSENVIIRNNVLDTSHRYLLVSAYVNGQREMAPIVKGNTWIQRDGSKSAVALQVDTNVHGWSNHKKYELPSGDLAEMTASVKKVDLTPVKILYEG